MAAVFIAALLATAAIIGAQAAQQPGHPYTQHAPAYQQQQQTTQQQDPRYSTQSAINSNTRTPHPQNPTTPHGHQHSTQNQRHQTTHPTRAAPTTQHQQQPRSTSPVQAYHTYAPSTVPRTPHSTQPTHRPLPPSTTHHQQQRTSYPPQQHQRHNHHHQTQHPSSIHPTPFTPRPTPRPTADSRRAPVVYHPPVQHHRSGVSPTTRYPPVQQHYQHTTSQRPPNPLTHHSTSQHYPSSTTYHQTTHPGTQYHNPSTVAGEIARRRQVDEQRQRDDAQRKAVEQKRLHDDKKRMEDHQRAQLEATERIRVEHARVLAENERKRKEEEARRRHEEEQRRAMHTPDPKMTQQVLHAQNAAALQAHAVNIQDPRNHYNSNMMTALSAPSIPGSVGNCDIPPDLWCDSPDGARACGVEKQCNALKRRGRPLKITLIYEALCPFCKRFIAGQLGNVFESMGNLFELELIPWGNARMLPDGSFSCNHGQRECDANRLQSCVLDKLGVRGSMPFIVCFEKHIFSETVESSMAKCSAFIRSNEREIRSCYDGERGRQLQRIAAERTFAARPQPIVEVPYILINDYSPTTENNDMNILLFPQMINKWSKIYSQR